MVTLVFGSHQSKFIYFILPVSPIRRPEKLTHLPDKESLSDLPKGGRGGGALRSMFVPTALPTFHKFLGLLAPHLFYSKSILSILNLSLTY